MKPGYKTTEFWFALLFDLAQLAAVYQAGPVTIPGIASAAYSLSRGLAKGGLIRGAVGEALKRDDGRLK